MAINVLIADDHRVVRDSLHGLLTRLPDMHPVVINGDHESGETHLGRDAIDVVILNMTAEISIGAEKIRHLQETLPHAKLIVMALRTDRPFVQQVFAMGVSGYMLKDCAYEELPEAVRCVCAGGLFVSREIDCFPECCRMMEA